MKQRRDLLRSGTWCCCWARSTSPAARPSWRCASGRRADYTRVTIESDAPLRSTQIFVDQPAAPGGGHRRPGTRARRCANWSAKIRPTIPTSPAARRPVRAGRGAPGVRPEAAGRAAGLHAGAGGRLPAPPGVRPVSRSSRSRSAGGADRRAHARRRPARCRAARRDPLGELIAARQPAPLRRPGCRHRRGHRPASPAPHRPRRRPPPPASRTDRLIIVALDPGHGGEDPGAIGPGGTREKDVVLQIARRLRDRINAAAQRQSHARLPDARRRLLRALHVRVQKARRVQADLFVASTPMPSSRPSARGASVFALSQSGASQHAPRAGWPTRKTRPTWSAASTSGGHDAQVPRAMLDMSTTAQINDSLKLGSAMLGEIGSVGTPAQARRSNRPASRCSRRRTFPACWSRPPSSATPKKKRGCAATTTRTAGRRADARHPALLRQEPAAGAQPAPLSPAQPAILPCRR